jgi:O-antigen/teichoic acid export membrane protein
MQFSWDSFKDLGAFGSRLFASSILDVAYKNVYYMVIGRYFSATDLGFYARADQFKNLLSQNITSTLQRVIYPVLSSLQDDVTRLRAGYQKAIKTTTFVSFPLLAGMAVIAEPLIVLLIGRKWLPVVPLLRMLCFVGAFHPLHALNLSVLKVLGRSDLHLRLELIKKLMVVPVIIVGIQWGLEGLIYGLMFQTVVAYVVNSFYTKRLIDYPPLKQIMDVLPAACAALLMSTLVFGMDVILDLRSMIELPILVVAGAILYYLIGRVMRLDALDEIEEGLGRILGRSKLSGNGA